MKVLDILKSSKASDKNDTDIKNTLALMYDSVKQIRNGLYITELGGNQGIIVPSNNFVIEPIYSDIDTYRDYIIAHRSIIIESEIMQPRESFVWDLLDYSGKKILTSGINGEVSELQGIGICVEGINGDRGNFLVMNSITKKSREFYWFNGGFDDCRFAKIDDMNATILTRDDTIWSECDDNKTISLDTIASSCGIEAMANQMRASRLGETSDEDIKQELTDELHRLILVLDYECVDITDIIIECILHEADYEEDYN